MRASRNITRKTLSRFVLCMAIIISAMVFDNYYSMLNITVPTQLENLIKQTKQNNSENKNNTIEFCHLDFVYIVKTIDFGKELNERNTNFTSQNEMSQIINTLQHRYFMQSDKIEKKVNICKKHFFNFNTHHKSISDDEPLT